MALVKTCTTCGAAAEPSEMMCPRCFGDISGVAPKEMTSEPPLVEGPALLHLVHSSGKIELHDGDFVGRSAVGAEYLAGFNKVSRQHASFRFENGAWYVEDAGSSNGTFVDEARILPHQPVRIKAGTRIRLSSTFEAIVETTGA